MAGQPARTGEDRPTMPAAEPRPGASRFVEGRARYVADLPADGCLEVAFARSPVAHGEILRVDLAPALAPHGPAVVGLTGRDAVASSGPLPHRWHISSHAAYDY